jgi:hypothetical protein
VPDARHTGLLPPDPPPPPPAPTRHSLAAFALAGANTHAGPPAPTRRRRNPGAAPAEQQASRQGISELQKRRLLALPYLALHNAPVAPQLPLPPALLSTNLASTAWRGSERPPAAASFQPCL